MLIKRHLITLYMARPAILCWLAHRKWRSEIERGRGWAIRHCDECDLTWISLSGFTKEVIAVVELTFLSIVAILFVGAFYVAVRFY